jgi:hypothetical protein
MTIVNWTLIKHPLNWFTVLLMLFLAAVAGTLILEAFGIQPNTADSSDDGSNGSITGAASYGAGSVPTGGPGPHATVSSIPAPGIAIGDVVMVYG